MAGRYRFLSCPLSLAALLMPVSDVPTYSTPAAFRRLENLHILFWLVKDLSWCLIWRPLGIAMMLPTLGIAGLIYWRTRHLPTERAFNLAILCWITANSYWMMSEFLGFETTPLFGGALLSKHLAVVPFGAGLLVLAVHYGRVLIRARR